MAKRKYELQLPYYKQGDDLAYYISVSKTPAEALVKYVDRLDSAALMLERLADVALDNDIELHGGSHFIQVVCEQELGDRLMKEKLLTESPDDYEEDCDFIEEDGGF